ncbi:MAG: cobyrinate a,c-diamide synthase [Candidatus Thermoplasmatota archaeon]|jgi:cobyrinic acid a,c-diamide synthase|nr:cobyrinate a,c-diamide synthase [Candidatus Thermoplasmatota archaeon]MCL5791273.1 cobyrinate a,c-diamide synthase [Candidatus Thermoplasmatota archaeon]
MKSIGITAMSTGSGKTSVTAAMLHALKGSVQVKIGPDFIDPLVLKSVNGSKGYNMDRWIQGRGYLNIPGIASRKNDFAIYEGVMGFYDSGIGKQYSTQAYFEKMKIPYILVVDVLRYGESIYYSTVGFRRKSLLGVILNRYSTERHLELVEKPFRDHGVRILGAVPYRSDLEIRERHLGINIEEGQKKAVQVGRIVSEYLDLDFLDEINDQEYHEGNSVEMERRDYRISIALDDAFNFYYRDAMEYLEKNFSVEYFSPLKNEVPRDPDFVYIGGGYPELHGETLENASDTIEFLRDFHKGGGKIYTECGGTMFLLQKMIAGEREYQMAGIFEGLSRMEKTPVLSYTELQSDGRNTFYGNGQIVRGHEFHYSRIETREKMAFSVRRGKGMDGKDGISSRNALGMYTHIDMMRYGNNIFKN